MFIGDRPIFAYTNIALNTWLHFVLCLGLPVQFGQSSFLAANCQLDSEE